MSGPHDEIVAAVLRRLHDPQHGDVVLPHLVVSLYSENPVENGLVLRLWDLANGRTGAQHCPPGTAQNDWDYPIKVCD